MEWDDRLISRADAADLAGDHPVAWHVDPDSGNLLLRCGQCGQSCGMWPPAYPTSVDEFTAAVIRHRVTAHDLPLNKAALERMRNGERNQPAGADGAGQGQPQPDHGGAAAGGGGGGVAADPDRDGPDSRDTPHTNPDRAAGG